MRDLSPMSSSGRQKGSRDKKPPDVTFIFADDVTEWDSYLSHQLEGSGATVHHEQVERMSFPLGCTRAPLFSEARVVLVILSPALVSFLDRRAADCFQFTRLLRPAKTIGMACGATRAAIAAVKNVLVSFDDWRHLEAKDKDINMVRSVIEMIQDTLLQSKESERISKPKFKLVPRKVHEGSGKVYVMLAKPLDGNSKVRVTLESKGAREVLVKRRNPYTLAFVIPDDLIHVQSMVNVHVWQGEDLLGVSSVKCASKLGELHSLLSSVPSPYEFLCTTLGVGALHEADSHLVAVFRKNLPLCGLETLQFGDKQDREGVRGEFPTLLHFAARYGLLQLVRELSAFPGARGAALLKNDRGLTPAQMANREGHNKVAAFLDDYCRDCGENRQLLDKAVPCNPINSNHLNSEPAAKQSNPLDYYDIPAQPIPVVCLPANRVASNVTNEQDNNYMNMKGDHKENIEPIQNVFLEEHLDSMKNITSTEKAKLNLLESQAKLIDIMEAYKKGASLTEVEIMHNEWKMHYQVSDVEAKSTLDGLRNLYAKAQKAAKLNKKHSSSFSELRNFLNSKLRRKESIESKGSMSRRSSKDSSCSEIRVEAEAPRPVSTLSVLSNTSSSSGSSFDRLSTVSAGSDSGHHSDFVEDRNPKSRDRSDSRPPQQPRYVKGVQSLSLSSKPPAPPPRRDEAPHYSSVSRKWAPPSFEEVLGMADYPQPGSRASTLDGSRRSSERKMSTSSADFDSRCGDYDRPPPPRSSSSLSRPFPDPRTDYDLVPPPLPLSPMPLKQQDSSDAYDIPPTLLRSNSLSSNSRSWAAPPTADYDFPRAVADYDLPRTTADSNNTDTRPACTCLRGVGFVKSC